jgi:hypothetical protein
VWTQLPANASAVVLELADGSGYWQRPTARTVFFNLPDERSLASTQVSMLDVDGNVLTASRSMDPEQ